MKSPYYKKALKLFLLPILLILVIELIFRLGAWESMLKPNSHAFFSKQAIQFEQVFKSGRVNVVTVGDSRARIGIDHGYITEQQRLIGLNQLNMTMNRSHLTTFKAVTDWSINNLNGFDTIIIAMSKTGLHQIYYGSFELAKVQPFQPWYQLKKTRVYEVIGYKGGIIQRLANWSALIAYRKDIRDFLANPLQRFRELSSASYEQNVYRNIGANEHVCNLDLSSISGCQKHANDPDLNKGRQNAFKRYCLDETALTIQQNGRRYLPNKAIKIASNYWSDYLRQVTDNNVNVVLMWLPDHQLLKKDLAFANEGLIYKNIKKLINNHPMIRELDLTNLFDQQSLDACHFFYELVHPNHLGAQVITQRLSDFLSHTDYR